MSEESQRTHRDVAEGYVSSRWPERRRAERQTLESAFIAGMRAQRRSTRLAQIADDASGTTRQSPSVRERASGNDLPAQVGVVEEGEDQR